MRAHPLWQRRGELPDGEGVGVAIGWWPGGLEPAAASCRLDSDGKLTIVTGAVDMSGTETAFQSIAAEAFGLADERVRVVAGDTAGAPYAGLSGGSKVTYTVGRAVAARRREARERLLEVAATELEIAPEDLEIVDGEVRPVGSPDRGVAIAELAAQGAAASAARYAPVEGYGGIAQTSRAPGAAAHLSHVRVDRETGAVTAAAPRHRPGRRPRAEPRARRGPAARRRRAGHRLGAARGARLRRGRASCAPARSSSTRCPSIDTVPPIETEIVEVPAPDGPFGAKGIGEPPVVGVPAAVANAIAAATGAAAARAADDAAAGLGGAERVGPSGCRQLRKRLGQNLDPLGERALVERRVAEDEARAARAARCDTAPSP